MGGFKSFVALMGQLTYLIARFIFLDQASLRNLQFRSDDGWPKVQCSVTIEELRRVEAVARKSELSKATRRIMDLFLFDLSGYPRHVLGICSS